MTRLLVAAIAALGCGSAVAQAGWFSDELPPADAKPLSQIVKTL